jgi:hypothetical protein
VSAGLTALYATVVLFVPIVHAATEVAASVPSVERAHTDDCARLHGGAACYVLATLQAAHPSPPARTAPDGPSSTADSFPQRVSPIRPTVSLSPPARAPPHR